MQKLSDNDDDVTRWLSVLIYMYIQKYDYDLDFSLMVMVMQYYRPLWTDFSRGCIWGDYNSLHRDCMGDESSGKVVGVSP